MVMLVSISSVNMNVYTIYRYANFKRIHMMIKILTNAEFTMKEEAGFRSWRTNLKIKRLDSARMPIL